MNIISNKEVFSEENQANTPKKVELRRGRPRKISLPIETAPAPQPEAINQGEISLGSPVTATQIAKELGVEPAPTTRNSKPFYQASRQHTEAAIDPRTLAMRAREQRNQEQSTGQPQPLTPPAPGRREQANVNPPTSGGRPPPPPPPPAKTGG